ncbi:MAG: DUF6941 family protein [Acidimicrobiia bacterium]
MQCTAILADSVVCAEGKLYVQGGGWTTIWTNQVPLQWPRVGIGLLITVPWLDTPQEHTFSLRVENEDGQVLSLGASPPDTAGEVEALDALGGEFFVGRPRGLPDGDNQVVPVALNIDGLVLPRFGAYRFVIQLDGADATSMRFRVAAPPG